MSWQTPVFAHNWSETRIARLISPMQTFIHRSAASGIVLLPATLLALVFANSGLADAYNHLLETKVSFTAGPFELQESVLHWIKDGLMAIFFFLVGLTIKREVLVGELANIWAASLPIDAAIGFCSVESIVLIDDAQTLLAMGNVDYRR